MFLFYLLTTNEKNKSEQDIFHLIFINVVKQQLRLQPRIEE